MRPCIAGIRLGDPDADLSCLDELLRDSRIFGVDLFEAGLADLVKSYFKELTAGNGAVAATLEKHLA